MDLHTLSALMNGYTAGVVDPGIVADYLEEHGDPRYGMFRGKPTLKPLVDRRYWFPDVAWEDPPRLTWNGLGVSPLAATYHTMQMGEVLEEFSRLNWRGMQRIIEMFGVPEDIVRRQP